jgi:hypothetical protein
LGIFTRKLLGLDKKKEKLVDQLLLRAFIYRTFRSARIENRRLPITKTVIVKEVIPSAAGLDARTA